MEMEQSNVTLTADERYESISKLLDQPGPTVGEDNVAFHWRADCEYLYWELGEAKDMLEQADPYLRTLASQCEACEGSGEIVHGPNDEEAYSEPCKHCKPLWDLIERMEPPSRLPPTQTVEEVEDDIAF